MATPTPTPAPARPKLGPAAVAPTTVPVVDTAPEVLAALPFAAADLVLAEAVIPAAEPTCML